MNQDQVLSVIRWLLSVGGPLGGLLVAKGIIPANELGTFTSALIAFLSTAAPLAALVWSMFRHSDAGKLAAVEAMPDVKAITVVPPAVAVSPAVVDAAADPTRNKVRTTT